MKRLLLVFIFLFTIEASVFSLARFAVKEPVLYVDFNIKNINDSLVNIWEKLVGKEQFTIQYSLFKSFIVSSLDGIDITDEKFLRSVGISVNSLSGFIINSFKGKELNFIFAISTNDSKLARKFFIDLVIKNINDKTTRVNRLYKGNMITSIKYNIPSNGSDSEEFSICVVDGYLLIGKFAYIKLAIDKFKSEDNFASSDTYKKSKIYVKGKKLLIFFIFTKQTFEELFKYALANTPKKDNNTDIIKLYKDLYNFMSIWFLSNDNDISMEGIVEFNKNSSIYPSIIKVYNPDIINRVNLFNYLPVNPYLSMNLYFDSQEYFNNVLPYLFDVKDEFVKEFVKEIENGLDELTKELDFDIRFNIINNLGNQYGLLVYDYGTKNEGVDFFKELDFLTYVNFNDEALLKAAIEILVSKLRDKVKEKDNSLDMVITKHTINELEFYNFNINDEFNVYFGIFQKHLILASRKKRIETLINNFNMRRPSFKNSLKSSGILDEINETSNHLFIDLKKVYNDKKLPLQWIESISSSIKLNSFKFFKFHSRFDNGIGFSSLKVTFK